MDLPFDTPQKLSLSLVRARPCMEIKRCREIFWKIICLPVHDGLVLLNLNAPARIGQFHRAPGVLVETLAQIYFNDRCEFLKWNRGSC